MSIVYVRKAYQMPWLKRGLRVDLNGKKGRVTGAGTAAYVHVLFDGERLPSNCHPTWEMTYYDLQGNTMIADYKSKQPEGSPVGA